MTKTRLSILRKENRFGGMTFDPEFTAAPESMELHPLEKDGPTENNTAWIVGVFETMPKALQAAADYAALPVWRVTEFGGNVRYTIGTKRPSIDPRCDLVKRMAIPAVGVKGLGL